MSRGSSKKGNKIKHQYEYRQITSSKEAGKQISLHHCIKQRKHRRLVRRLKSMWRQWDFLAEEWPVLNDIQQS